MTIELRDYQINGMGKLWSYFQSGNKGNPVLAWPCGSGKTICPAIFIKHCLTQWPNLRFMLVTSVSELIKQNADVMREVWPNCPLGIYSAALKQKNYSMPVVYGSIQSMAKDPAKFGHRDIIWCDEAHLIPPEETSMYQTFFATLKLINPDLRIIGLTGTPFRAGLGLITDNGIFTDIVHDITRGDAFVKLISDGYLVPLISRRTQTELDVSNVSISKGDYIGSQLQKAVDVNEVTFSALKEACIAGENRKSWLIFASGIEHSNHIAEQLNAFGISCASVHSKQTNEYNDKAIIAFKNEDLRAISSYSKIAIGFNHPGVDFIIDLRPTLSVAFHIQKYGRALRPAPGKKNGLILDFARNVPRLGCINDPIIPHKKGEAGGGVAPIKICENCGIYNHAAARFCCNCGAEFQFKIKITERSSTSEIIKSDLPVIEWYSVDRAVYSRKNGMKAPYIKATYICCGGMHTFIENVFPENQKYKKPFHDWWKQRHTSDPPTNTDEALKYLSELRVPQRIKVWVNRKYPEIMMAEY